MGAYEHLQERLERGEPVLLDGGVGAELVRRAVRWRGHGMRTDSDAVRAIHREYLDSGADVIRTNTFQLNRHAYANVFRDAEHMRRIGAPGLENRAADLTRRAVALAREARDDSGPSRAAVAGVMSPLEHCFRPDLAPSYEEARPEHDELATLLAESGVDLLLLESMNTIGEARAAADAALATGLPVWVSFVIGPDGSVLGGDPLDKAARAVRELGVQAVLVNCAPPEDMGLAVKRLRATVDCYIGAYAHVGKFDPPSWKFEFFPQFTGTEAWPPERYAALARQWRQDGASIIGGCCGAGPAHIQAFAGQVKGAGEA